MKLEDLPDGSRILVDANILIYHFSGISLECRAFLQRCESRQVTAFTGVHIVLEVTHRLMILEALQKGLITGGQPARKLQEQPEIIKVLQEYKSVSPTHSSSEYPRENDYLCGCPSQRSHTGAGRVDDQRFGHGGPHAKAGPDSYRNG